LPVVGESVLISDELLPMNFIARGIDQLQEITLLTWRALRGLLRRPFYGRELIEQMDLLGVGSLAIILLTGLAIGGVLALNTASTFQRFGATSFTGEVVTLTMVREIGPLLACVMLAGRVGSGIAAELGSMLVSEQIDAMRALGTDPVKKLVIPRLLALIIMAPILTIICDMSGVIGGMVVAIQLMRQSASVYLASTKLALDYPEIAGGLLKPVVFGYIVGIVGCYMGLSTTGGTVGVGRSTTKSVVVASITVIVVDFFLSKLLLAVLLTR
jgi:phospholipid/cholesterol/gamma-HCH transport system permease protein